jgi:hypothetical protein
MMMVLRMLTAILRLEMRPRAIIEPPQQPAIDGDVYKQLVVACLLEPIKLSSHAMYKLVARLTPFELRSTASITHTANDEPIAPSLDEIDRPFLTEDFAGL